MAAMLKTNASHFKLWNKQAVKELAAFWFHFIETTVIEQQVNELFFINEKKISKKRCMRQLALERVRQTETNVTQGDMSDVTHERNMKQIRHKGHMRDIRAHDACMENMRHLRHWVKKLWNIKQDKHLRDTRHVQHTGTNENMRHVTDMKNVFTDTMRRMKWA